MAIVEISVTPLGIGKMGVSEYVAGCVKLAQESGLSCQLTPMGTIIEGEIEQLFPLLQRMHESPFAAGAERVSTLIKIDDRRDRKHSMQGKVDSVMEKFK
ncbi:MAG: hypothetical protein C0615_01805 [Desulfuromonas sp.]|nr:MAG: hypothetical protein C0615_01805 [Desulfuromonas sp.]